MCCEAILMDKVHAHDYKTGHRNFNVRGQMLRSHTRLSEIKSMKMAIALIGHQFDTF
jgi:hypothetical protein